MKLNLNLKIAIIAGVFTAPTAAFAQSDTFSHTGSVAMESGRLFPEQGLALYDGFTVVADYTITHNQSGWYGNLWHAETGTRANNETDVCIGNRGAIDSATSYDVSGCMFEIAGPEAYRLRLAASHALNENWVVAVNGDIVRGGFETDTVRAQLQWHDEIFGPFTGSGSVGVSYDTWSEDTVARLKLGVSFPIFGVTATAAYDRFEVVSQGPLSRSSDRNGENFSLSVGFAF